MHTCLEYRDQPGYPGCCSECHRESMETAQPMEPNPEQPSGGSVCCYVAIWLRERLSACASTAS